MIRIKQTEEDCVHWFTAVQYIYLVALMFDTMIM